VVLSPESPSSESWAGGGCGCPNSFITSPHWWW
jgi:hypothetical protein